MALEVLRGLGYSTEGLRSKSWDEFAQPGSPPLDFVFTVCDTAAGEACPLWPGQPVTAHWGVEDPAAFVGPPDAQRRLFSRIYFELEARIRVFASLPLEDFDPLGRGVGSARSAAAHREARRPHRPERLASPRREALGRPLLPQDPEVAGQEEQRRQAERD